MWRIWDYLVGNGANENIAGVNENDVNDLNAGQDGAEAQIGNPEVTPGRNGSKVAWHPKELLTNYGALACPICRGPYVTGRIFQCPNGHLRCENCVKVVHRCPKCPTYNTFNARNRQLEYIVQSTPVLNVVTGAATDITPDEAHQKNGAIFEGITCKNMGCPSFGSNTYITGTRYKCMTCNNMDFCKDCAQSGVHDHHPLICISGPDQSNVAKEILDAGKKPMKINRGRAEGGRLQNATAPIGFALGEAPGDSFKE